MDPFPTGELGYNFVCFVDRFVHFLLMCNYNDL